MTLQTKIAILTCAMGILASCTGVAGLAGRTVIGQHEGPRFSHEISVKNCILTETQWEKRGGGTLILWEETKFALRGASLLDFKAYGRPEGSPASTSAVLDNTQDADKPGASLTVLAAKGQTGKVEMLNTRNLATAKIKRKKATPSPRNGGNTHVVFPTSQMLILFRGSDVLPQMQKLEQALLGQIAACTPAS